MVHYLVEGVGTPQGWAALVQDPRDRAEVLRPLYEKFGCTLKEYYFAVTQNKFYYILEAPQPLDPLDLGAFIAGGMASGVIASSSLTQVVTSAEMVEALKRVPTVGYRPPGTES